LLLLLLLLGLGLLVVGLLQPLLLLVVLAG
jgi:hypothetical protein